MRLAEVVQTPWKPVSKAGLAAGVTASLLFFVHALRNADGFLLLDHVNLPFHEFGHLFFGILGETFGIWGGTLFQLMVPGGIFVSFVLRRETSGAAFSGFWFGENLLNIATYIGDARRMFLPLVGGGEHDWNIILSGLGVLRYDTVIAGVVRASGWMIMIGVMVWFVVRGLKE